MIEFVVVLLMGFADLYRGSSAGIHRQFEKLIYGFLAGFVLIGASLWSSWLFLVLFLACFMVGSSISWGTPIGGALRRLNKDQYAKLLQSDRDNGRSMWYLRGYFKHTAYRGLFARGFIWGFLPAIPVAYFVGVVPALILILAYTIAMPLAIWFVLKFENSKFDLLIKSFVMKITKTKTNTKGRTDTWSRQEIYRGWIVGLIILLFSLI